MDNIEKEKRVKQLMISGLTRSKALIYYYEENPKPLYDRIPNTSLERLRLIEIEIYMDRYEMSKEEATDHWNLIREVEWMRSFAEKQKIKEIKKSNSGCMLVLIILITPIILISLLTYNN